MKEEEKKELLKQEKKNNRRDGERTLFGKIINIILWIVVLAWMAICVTDYIKVQNEEKPIFCLSKETVKYKDGNVYVCHGLGYKVLDYNRSCFKALQYGAFWTKDASLKNDRCN